MAKAPAKKAPARTARSTRDAGKTKSGKASTTLQLKQASGRTGSAVSTGAKPGSVGPVRMPVRDLIRAEANNAMPVPAPVPSNSKPRKNQAGFSARDLEHFRDLLMAKRREIVGDMSSMEREALRSSGGSNLSTLPIHMADMGTDNYEQEFTLGLVETERKLLREINRALAKIQDGTFGICEGTGKPISKARLQVQPWARFSIEYAKQMEGRGR